ncbi:bifunctional UDP-N-acetylglucosamine diphosphorylase/glucosamine-1-phosphate N-acetyltransferase GlmU [Alkalicoccus luteus]|uniref:Bifunctional protein GlmU n=1 Tax=Alkalicoccus luteus TaxID=1237094 RepID=A0A969TWG0_9BACI|nr:bifunctional UDP-N-acetylglucosamine diphosphorylase/glucosamine-1-phosphate N-acetyltransferase GlmU [Alkalicoccus luteus]NJP39021.1 bifunctional UDP-N-acetylglucosamine diphosphorylase/glucosamine-1-phosphate N-acetyltransferase GlmU [Alkalicoccus luteus]
MTNRFAVVLAAGKGTRMKSSLYKVLHPVGGKPMVQHVTDQLQQCGLEKMVTVVGHGADTVKDQLGSVTDYVLQAEQLGTGHAVMQAEEQLGGKSGTTLVVCGDTPLLTAETLQNLLDAHEAKEAKATILTAHADNPAGYGRVIRDGAGKVVKIVEQKDASDEEKQVQEINTGTYCFDNAALFDTLRRVGNDNAQGEYYLPDVIEILQEQGEAVFAHQSSDFHETMGVNDRVALSQAEAHLKKRINEHWMREGVTITDPDSVYIGADVMIGSDTVLYPGTMLQGDTQVGSGCEIGPHTEIRDSRIADETVIRQSVVHRSSIGSRAAVGPFAHIRPETALEDEVRVGNFVELKKMRMGTGSKASHLSYLGDADIGAGVNVGCGSITVNYDGKNKHLTTIEDDAFIGCNSNLIAPVTVGRGSYVAAGSTITDDVPGESLAIARQRQTNKEGYTRRS